MVSAGISGSSAWLMGDSGETGEIGDFGDVGESGSEPKSLVGEVGERGDDEKRGEQFSLLTEIFLRSAVEAGPWRRGVDGEERPSFAGVSFGPPLAFDFGVTLASIPGSGVDSPLRIPGNPF